MPKSREAGDEAHEEMLFITTHQVYELLFKQVLHELGSVTAIFSRVVRGARACTTPVQEARAHRRRSRGHDEAPHYRKCRMTLSAPA